jgi:hypothetical protein
MELSIVVCDPLAFFFPMHEHTFQFIFRCLSQNLSNDFEHVLLTVQDPLGGLLLSPAKQIEACDGKVG